MFPDDATLLARGKYSTLSKERRQQLERVQNICTTLTTNSLAALRDCEVMPPVSTGPIDLIEKCLTNLKDARERITKLSNDMLLLKPSAWPTMSTPTGHLDPLLEAEGRN